MKTVKQVAQELGVPAITIYKWLEKNKYSKFGGHMYILDEATIKRFRGRNESRSKTV